MSEIAQDPPAVVTWQVEGSPVRAPVAGWDLHPGAIVKFVCAAGLCRPVAASTAYADRFPTASLHADANTQLTCPDPFAVLPLICCEMPAGISSSLFTATYAAQQPPVVLKCVAYGSLFGAALTGSELQLAAVVKFVCAAGL